MLFYVLLVLGGFVGGFVNGLAGFGTALFALGFFLAILSPAEAVAIIFLMSFVGGLMGLWAVRSQLRASWQLAAHFILPGMLCVPFGVLALAVIDASLLRLMVGVMLVGYGGYFTFANQLPQLGGSYPYCDRIIGAVGGFLGGLASLSGALPTMWLAMRTLPKGEMRSVIQSYNMVMVSLAILLLWWQGGYQQPSLIAHSLIAVASAMIGARAGLWLFHHLRDAQFKRLIVTLTLLSGCAVLGHALAS